MKRYSIILSKGAHLLGTLILLALLVSCNRNGSGGSGEVLVRVYDKYLYASDLEGVIPPGASARDSLTAVRNFIQNWVDRELIVKKAEENLPDDLRDFSDRIEEYRNSLIIFEYERMLVNQELDTNISREAILEYYQREKGNFLLKNDIVDLQYLKLHVDSPAIGKFRQFIQSELPDEQDSLAMYSSKYASGFSIMQDNWISIDEMLAFFPVQDYSYNDFRLNRDYLEVRDSVFIYMIHVMDYKPADSMPPVNFVERDIKNIILNKRKKDLIKNMRQSVLQDAIEHNQVEIF
ncbi:MAG: hypothetical protein V2I47_13375 [Bacteroidales bacterium]|jgi:hypothetical protein|nr:hypothetical protein [Bacteroidales bacterium]